ncbi:GTP-binding protein 8-like [Acipenser oxyrinchus oxyrinchus]|uniref:GTP-binding protein 8 n=1 Tax=Acipenser oxyrinchus oxyrinchus TaxID=40147 RepID=A0AAD8LN67_ACIOX|nr:GTP-binding protein 8-like [Acipenser oxyrinchus oxyrinchus]
MKLLYYSVYSADIRNSHKHTDLSHFEFPENIWCCQKKKFHIKPHTIVLKAIPKLQKSISTTQTCQSNYKLSSFLEAAKMPKKKLRKLVFPFEDLERHLSSKVNTSNLQLFLPRFDDIKMAEMLTKKQKIDYFTSAVRMDHAPLITQSEVSENAQSKTACETACLKDEKEVTKTDIILFSCLIQGHIKKMNFFTVGKAFTLVDMPGYGYKAPKDFVDMVETYLETRHNLKRTFLLVDGSVGLQHADRIAIDMCEEFGLPYVLVITKIDKAKQGELLRHILEVQEVIQNHTVGCFPQPFLVSSLHYSGVYLLRCFIAHVTGNLKLGPS